MRCPVCGSDDIYKQDGYDTIFRCAKCDMVGNEDDFL